MTALAPSTEMRGELRRNEPMARHTSWGVGGAADRFYLPADLDDLALFLSQLPADEPLMWLGLGSNLLVRDGGIRGTVISTRALLSDLVIKEGGSMRAGAGVVCAKVARSAARHGLSGVEFLAGIPGTVGGALKMNAGAFGSETWSLVSAVETIDRRGQVRRRQPGAYRIGYRNVVGPAGEWFVAAHFSLKPDDGGAGAARIKQLLGKRAACQPTAERSCGSVFRNPPGDHAGRLIDACNLKGFAIGNAVVSSKHANFILNRGGATAADIEALIDHVATVVADSHGVHLEPEVHIVGERCP